MHKMAVYLRGSSLADLTQPESGYRFLRRLFYCPDGRKGRNKMEFPVSSKIYLLLLGFAVNILVCGVGDASTTSVLDTITGADGYVLQQESAPQIVDFNDDGKVDIEDLLILIEYWGQDEPLVDIAPPPFGDGIVDMKDLEVLMSFWLEDVTEEIVYIQWLGHSSVKVWTEDCVVYVDPERLTESLHDATLVCVTHTHGDHYSPSDIAKVSNAQTQFVAPPDVVQRYGSGQTIAPGQTIQLNGVSVTAVPSYNTNKPNHPKSNNWVGYVIELAAKRIYVAGDTENTPEMASLEGIDVAFLPMNLPYTMTPEMAADAAKAFKPGIVYPYHYGETDTAELTALLAGEDIEVRIRQMQ